MSELFGLLTITITSTFDLQEEMFTLGDGEAPMGHFLQKDILLADNWFVPQTSNEAVTFFIDFQILSNKYQNFKGQQTYPVNSKFKPSQDMKNFQSYTVKSHFSSKIVCSMSFSKEVRKPC